jgi:flagellar biosynthesis/type III secretory pathway protein FliH
MTEELWIDKVTIKKLLRIDETGLIELVSQRIFTPHIKHTDDKYYPMPFTTEYYTKEWKFNSITGKDYRSNVPHRRDATKEEITERLKKCFWFRQIEFDDALYEGKIKLPETPLQADTKEDRIENISDYIKQRRREGISDGEIASKLYYHKYTYLEIGRAMGHNKGLNEDQTAAVKTRVTRLIKKYKASLVTPATP